MEANKEGMRPIWYFVGWVLMLIGGTVLLSGIYNLYFEVPNTTVLKNLHPNLWWGAFLWLVGVFFIWFNKNKRLR